MSTDATCKATDNYDGTYGITCTTTVSASYSLQIFLDLAGNERVLVGGPNNLNVVINPGQFSASDSVILAETSTIQAGQQYSAIIQGRDSFGNPQDSGGVAFDVSFTTNSSSPASMYDQKLVDRGNGKYDLTFFLYQKGSYLLTLSEQLTGLKVGSTMPLEVVTSSVDLGSSVLSGSGLNGGIAGQVSTMYLLLKDQYGNIADAKSGVSLVNFQFAPELAAPFYTNVSSVADFVELTYMAQFPGTYNLALTYNGSVYSNANTPLEAVKVSPQMSPEVSSAIFDGAYRKVFLTFDRGTDRGYDASLQSQATSSCDRFLQASTTALIGERPTCIWRDDKTLVITLGFGATLSPGNKVVLKDSVIMNAAKNSLYASGYSAVQASSEPSPVPNLSIVSAESVGVCDDIVIDVSDSTDQSGRRLTFTYTCESLHQEAFAVVEALASFVSTDQTRVTLSNALFAAGLDYQFGVEAKNFLGVSASSSVTVSKEAIPVPNIFINGGTTKNIATSQSLTVEAYASFPDGSCLSGRSGENFGNIQENMVFSWSQVEGPEATLASVTSEAERSAHEASKSTRYLYLPANMLSSGSYKFSITGNVKGSTQFASSAEVAIVVAASAISVSFAGSSRSVATSQDLTLTVDAVDPDNLNSNFEFSWSCKKVSDGGACPFTTTPIEFFRSSSTLPFSPSVGAYLPGGAYEFSVTVIKEPSQANRVVSKSLEITVVNTTSASPGLSIVAPQNADKFSPSEQLTLEATTLEAWQPFPVSDPPRYRLVWSGPPSMDLASVALTPLTDSSFLVISEGSLLGGQDYTFTATFETDDGKKWVADTSVSANDPPSSGLLQVSPTSGVEAQTLFQVSALNWVDSIGDAPFKYLFYAKDVSTPGNPWRLLALEQSFGSLNFILPPGTFIIKASIADVHGALTEIESATQIVVSELGGGGGARRRLLQSDNATLASAFVNDPIRRYMNLGELTLASMAVDIYKEKFVTPTNANVAQTCVAGFGVSSMAQPHAEVMAIVEEIRQLKPFSEALFQHQMCSYAEVSRDVPAVSADNAFTLYTAVARLQAMALGSTITLSPQSLSCMSEAISNLVLVLDAQCEAQPPQLRAEIFRLLDLMQQINKKQIGPNASPTTLTTTSFTTTVKKFVQSDGQNAFGLDLGTYGAFGAAYANFTSAFVGAGSSFTTMALTRVHVANLIDNVDTKTRVVSDLCMVEFDNGFESVEDVTTLGARALKTSNLQLQLKTMFPVTKLWNGNDWVSSGSGTDAINKAFDGVWAAGAKPTNDSVLTAAALDVVGKHTVESTSLYPSTYSLHFKKIVFGAFMEDIPQPPPPPPPPPPPSPPPPSPPPPPPLVVKEKEDFWDEINKIEIIIGIAAGGAVLLAAAVCCCARRKKRRRHRILQSAADDDTDIEDEDVPVIERRRSNEMEFGQLQALSSVGPSALLAPQASFNPFASNQGLPFLGSNNGGNKTLRDMLLQTNRS